MTMPGNHNYNLTVDEARKIGEAVGPSIREGFRADLKSQTDEIRAIVNTHEGRVTNLLSAHEQNDNERFDKGDTRMGEIEKSNARWNGAIALLVIAIPVLVELAKWKFGK